MRFSAKTKQEIVDIKTGRPQPSWRWSSAQTIYAVVAQLVERIHGETYKSLAPHEGNLMLNPELRLKA